MGPAIGLLLHRMFHSHSWYMATPLKTGRCVATLCNHLRPIIPGNVSRELSTYLSYLSGWINRRETRILERLHWLSRRVTSSTAASKNAVFLVLMIWCISPCELSLTIIFTKTYSSEITIKKITLPRDVFLVSMWNNSLRSFVFQCGITLFKNYKNVSVCLFWKLKLTEARLSDRIFCVFNA